MKDILIALDLQTDSIKLVEYGIMLASKFNSKLWFIHVAAPDPDFVGYDVGPQNVRDDVAFDLRDAHRKLQALSEHAGLKSEALLVQGPTVKTIIEEAEKLNVSLIITGIHEHSFMHNLFAENTALKLFSKCKIPVLGIPLDQ